jgi:hypothetical protein
MHSKSAHHCKPAFLLLCTLWDMSVWSAGVVVQARPRIICTVFGEVSVRNSIPLGSNPIT